MIIDAHATDTVPSHEVRQRAQQALANAGEPMSEVTYDALRKRLAEAEEELSIWKSVFPDIAPERVMPDRSLLHAEIGKLREALKKARLDALEEAEAAVSESLQRSQAIAAIHALRRKQ